MDGTARVWNSETGQPVTSALKHNGPVRHAAFTKDGRRVATASEDRTARIWKLTADARPAAQVLRVAELLAGQEIDATGGLVPLDTEKIQRLWKEHVALLRAAEEPSQPGKNAHSH